MKEEKENLILKFFGYFVGPIQFVMEVSIIINTTFFLSFCHQFSIVLCYVWLCFARFSARSHYFFGRSPKIAHYKNGF